MTYEADWQILQYLREMRASGRSAFVEIDTSAIKSGTSQDLVNIKSRVNEIKADTAGYPAVAGWYLLDEPDTCDATLQAKLKAAYDAIKEVDSLHITFAAPTRVRSGCPPGFGPGYPFLDAMDYGIIDPYPIPYEPPDSILVDLTQAQGAGKAFDMTIQAYQIDLNSHWPGDEPGASRFPSTPWLSTTGPATSSSTATGSLISSPGSRGSG